ncbi:MAG: NAD-dependent epimerase/dehydratase family protein [Opitutaceae bacterium]|nr:NAD-dependent epimerase/dehydratase family protein [Cytophagales bacterium]
MKLLITGIAGFVGSRLADFIKKSIPEVQIIGIDNLSRRGSETNLPLLKSLGCTFIHGDIRVKDDVEDLPDVDWIIDCAANPSVLAGINGGTSQLVQHNLSGTLNLLEKCRKSKCGFILLSTSRVYSINHLNSLSLKDTSSRFELDLDKNFPPGFTGLGVTENFPTAAPISIYGATKLASEVMALEYAMTFDFPIWVNRCGVIAGPGQFGKIDQGIFSFWIYNWMLNKPLGFIGYGGEGKQVRDLMHPNDLGLLLLKQINYGKNEGKKPHILNLGGGLEGSFSLKELNDYCKNRFNTEKLIGTEKSNRPFDLPYYVTDTSLAAEAWNWRPTRTGIEILDEISNWATENKELIVKNFA